jgi:tetraacyldisaccharide 4'-kinase
VGLIGVGTGREQSLDALRGAEVLAVAGIGRFDSFTGLLSRCGARLVETIQYPDHHPFSGADVERIITRARAAGAEMIVTTEKDAVKMDPRVGAAERMWAVRIAPRIEPRDRWDAMLDRVAAGARA